MGSISSTYVCCVFAKTGREAFFGSQWFGEKLSLKYVVLIAKKLRSQNVTEKSCAKHFRTKNARVRC